MERATKNKRYRSCGNCEIHTGEDGYSPFCKVRATIVEHCDDCTNYVQGNPWRDMVERISEESA